MSHPAFKAVKAANRELIKEFGGCDAVARFLGCSLALVGLWNNRNKPDITPWPEMVTLENDLGQPILSRAFAVLAGGTVTSSTPGGPAACVHSAISVVMAGVSDMTTAYGSAVADGNIDDAEDAIILGKAIKAREHLDRLIAGADHRSRLRVVQKTGGAK